MTKWRGPLFGPMMTLGLSVLVGVAFILFVGGAAGVVSGLTIPGAFALYTLTLVGGRDDDATAKPDGDVLVLPRLKRYSILLTLAHSVAAIAFLSIGSAAINDESYSGGYRGSAEALVFLAPPFIVLAVMAAVGGLLGRGAVRMSTEYIQWVPLIGRTKTCPWVWPDQNVQLDKYGTLTVLGGGKGVMVPMHTQRWSGTKILGCVRVFVASDAKHRRKMIAQGGAT